MSYTIYINSLRQRTIYISVFVLSTEINAFGKINKHENLSQFISAKSNCLKPNVRPFVRLSFHLSVRTLELPMGPKDPSALRRG